MASKNVENLRAAHESWNRRDFDGLVKTVADNVNYTDRARGSTMNNKQMFREFVKAWADAFPNGKIVNPQYIDAGSTVIAQFTMEGVNEGSMMGMKPTGRRASVSLCEIVNYDKNGIAVSGNIYYDQYSLLTQLGHIKPLATAA
jgi:steroid delta-isomerase-like uncharacterized protein